jgi:hypothetical protein
VYGSLVTSYCISGNSINTIFIDEKIVDYINTFGANNFEMLSRTQKERLFEIGE